MRELRGVFVLALLAGGLPPTAWGAPYWVAYEGDVFPEEVGWERVVIDFTGAEPPGAQRALLGDELRIDGTRSPDIADFYELERSINPEEGELFIAEWAVDVVGLTNPLGLSDVNVLIAPDQMGALAFAMFPDRIESRREGWAIDLASSGYHEYRIESLDMVSYDLWIDGVFMRSGEWDLESLNQSFVYFGDVARGAEVTSIADWDYVRFGVVPEPAALPLVLLVFARVIAQRGAH